MKSLGIYHASCFDGFGAAWVLRRYFGEENIELYAATHGDGPPEVTNRQVYIVDFSYKSDVLEQLASEAETLVVLDHHKTAQEDLAGFASFNTVTEWDEQQEAIMTLFDLARSGAGITWDFFFPNVDRPPLIDYIEDRDLWRFSLPQSREVHAGLSSYPFDFTLWDEFMTRHGTDILVDDGVALERKHHRDIDELLKITQRYMTIGGHANIPVANMPMTLTSDAGHKMADAPYPGSEGESYPPFAACYWDTPAGRVFSLRSTNRGLDVSEIAKLCGGGGHARAAGFRVPFDDLRQLGLL